MLKKDTRKHKHHFDRNDSLNFGESILFEHEKTATVFCRSYRYILYNRVLINPYFPCFNLSNS